MCPLIFRVRPRSGRALARDPLRARERTVGNDNTVKWRNLSLQIPPSRLRPHFVRATVRIHEYPDGDIAVFLGPHRLADYDRAGSLIDTNQIAA